MMKFEYAVAEWYHPANFQTWLNERGSDGWELVHTEHLLTKVGLLCIFKRRIKIVTREKSNPLSLARNSRIELWIF